MLREARENAVGFAQSAQAFGLKIEALELHICKAELERSKLIAQLCEFEQHLGRSSFQVATLSTGAPLVPPADFARHFPSVIAELVCDDQVKSTKDAGRDQSLSVSCIDGAVENEADSLAGAVSAEFFSKSSTAENIQSIGAINVDLIEVVGNSEESMACAVLAGLSVTELHV